MAALGRNEGNTQVSGGLLPRRIFRLRGGVQPYAWGSRDFIPALLGIPNPERSPFAELWMGAHPDLPASLEVDGNAVPLDALLEEHAAQLLGPGVCERFGGRLPYLFKILSAAAPLSIQAHPTKAQAEEGFAREQAAGIPSSARHRNYKDDNHKPEILAALTDFYALRGFRPLDEITHVLAGVPELRGVLPDYQPTAECLKRLYEKLMAIDQQQVDALLDPLVSRLAEADRRRRFSRDEREYWVLQADRAFSRDGHRDRGLFSIYLLNLVHLRPGEAVYLPAGVLHAYLQGSGVELMANSNNVLRGGLTPKHIDVPELLAKIVFQGDAAEVLRPQPTPQPSESVYRTPAPEFELSRIDVASDSPFRSGSEHSADIVIVTDSDEAAHIEIEAGDRTLPASRGDIFLAPWHVDYQIRALAPATLFRATVPEKVSGTFSRA